MYYFYQRDAICWRGISYDPVSVWVSVCHKPVSKRATRVEFVLGTEVSLGLLYFVLKKFAKIFHSGTLFGSSTATRLLAYYPHSGLLFVSITVRS